MSSVFISSLLKAATNWFSLIQSTPSASSIATSAVVEDLEKLERLLPRIKAVLVDAEERQIVDKSVKLWLEEIKDVAYDAEDVLDEYQYHVLRAQVENRAIAAATATSTSGASRKRKRVEGEMEVMPLASSASKISILSTMANRIKNIRKRFKEISKDRDRLHLKPEDGQRRSDGSSEYPHPTSHMVDEQEICGRVDDKVKLLDWLFSDKESKFEVLCVVGKGGLGKTTLAKLIYNDQKVLDYFKQRMWICVSDDFNLTRLTRAMIESITTEACTLSDQLSPLQETLHEKLQGKRVLLVLDDVWNENKSLWESLSISLHDAEMIRIIVTARNDSVAEIMQTTNPYRLGYLSEDQCWQLFLCHAFCRRDPKQFPSLIEIGKKIVKKCDGLPLAVKSLGGLLQHEIDEDRWNEVLHSKLWANKTDILPALMLSYIRMPTHLKSCFEICSIFPKGYLFRKDYLVNLWMANGYIQHQEKNVKEIGYMYFNELQRRSFFDKYWIDTFKMHDNIHDLADYVQVGMDSSNHKIRHLSIKNESLDSYTDDIIGALRTLILSIGNTVDINDMLRSNITRLVRLRYLEIKHSMFREELLLPDGLRRLICLRHLELVIANNMNLTESIANMYNLVVLDITCLGIVELPKALRNLVSLTAIRFNGFHNDQLPPLGQLPSLKSLTISKFHNVESIGNEFYRGAFPSLTSLVFNSLPKWKKWDELQEGDFSQLQKLEITRCDHLSVPSLRNLSLLSDISINDCGSLQFSPKGSFPPNLKTLENIHESVRETKKKKLEISLPQGFGELKKLKSLSGIFEVRIDDVFGILKNLVSLKCLIPSHTYRVDFSRGRKEVLQLNVKSNRKDACSFLLKNSLPDTLRNFVSLTTIHFSGFAINQLPALDQLQYLKSLTLNKLYNVRSIGNEFCRGGSNSRCVAFPSLTSLVFEELTNWEKWDELQEGDFPQLQKLKIYRCGRLSSLPSLGNLNLLSHMSLQECASLQLTPDGSFPPNLKALKNSRELQLSLPQGFGELKLESLSGLFGVRIYELSGILKSLTSLNYLILSNLLNAHTAWNDEACPKEYFGTQKLVLNWSLHSEPKSYSDRIEDLHLVVERYQNNQTNEKSFFVLEKLQPRTNLEELCIIGYDGVVGSLGYPSWIGHHSFDRLNKVRLKSCKIVQLPTLGQLPSLKHLHLHSIHCLKRIGYEFCRGISNNPSHGAVAFPSVVELSFKDMDSWEEWDGVRRFDFPNLECLSIHDCPRLLSLNNFLNNFAAKLEYLSIYGCPRLPSLHRCSAKRLCLESREVILKVRSDELFGTLNNLPVNTTKLTITALGNVRDALKVEANLESLNRLVSLTLKWSTDDDYANIPSLLVVVEDEDGNDDAASQIDNESFFALEKLQPSHLNLMLLKIEGYHGVGYPSWIGHPSFNTLTNIRLSSCKSDQLPTLGQLPHLDHLCIDSISSLKRIGDEFCRGTMMNNVDVAFPFLTNLEFRHMHDWEEWYGVLDEDFPRLKSLVIEDCPNLRKDLDFFPRRLLKYIYNEHIE